ncbi:MAG: PAS domain S-box protein, partial [Dehalococcoidia bacterium]|nr:PAS domain S-box protein [Dehalococcoidia bacterium]
MRLAVKETETKNLLETLANKSPVGLYIVQDGRFCYTDPTFQSTTGYTEDELVGRDALDFVVPEDKERVRENAIKMLKGELTLPYQFRVTNKDGSIKWIMESVISILYLGRRATLGDFVDITEHKRAEEAWRELEEEKSAFLEEAPVGIIHADLKGKITYVNKRFESESGYSRKEITGKSGFQLDWLPAGTMKYLTKRMAARLRGSPAKHWETQFKRKDGRWIWVEIEGKVLRRSGVPGGFQIIARNITERKQAEEALQAERNKLQSLIDAMEDTLTIQDPEYNIIYQNEPSRIASGGDHLGEKCYRVYEGRETVCEGCPVEKAFKDGKSYTAERMTTITGKVTFWENTANPIRDAEGKIVSCLEITRDITERKKQEQALADELTRRRLLIDQSLDGIVVLDVDAKVVEANQRFAEMLGYTLEEVHELHTWDWDKEFPPEKLMEMGRGIDEKGLHLETKHHRKDGSVIDVDISISAAMFGGQKLIFCVCRDITERKQAEEALQAERNKLQSLVDAMEDGLTIQDRDYNIIYEGRLQRTLFGDHLGEKCYRVYEGREKICEGCPVEKAFKDGKSHTSERRSVLPSGEVTFWENTANPIRDAHGEIVSCLEVGRNITEHKQAEEKLQAERNKLQSLIDTMEYTLTIQDTEYNIIFQNEHARSTFGDHLGEKCYRAYEGSDTVCEGCPVEEAFKDGKSHTAERQRVLSSGEIRFLEHTANPIRDAKGRVVSCLALG